jgi:thiamine-phosphate pyrophosphorylase
MIRAVDWSLYLVTDRALAKGRPISWIVEQAVLGGVTVVQLREKDCSAREFVQTAGEVKELLDRHGVPLIINDRVEVALAVQAAGVHIGQKDMPCADVRRLVGRKMLLGLSVETTAQAEEAEDLDVDYLGVSPIFATPTKPDLQTAWGLDGLKRLRARSRHKLIAIGGISDSNAADVIRAGADGIAVVSAICAADYPRAAAARLRAIIDSAPV